MYVLYIISCPCCRCYLPGDDFLWSISIHLLDEQLVYAIDRLVLSTASRSATPAQIEPKEPTIPPPKPPRSRIFTYSTQSLYPVSSAKYFNTLVPSFVTTIFFSFRNTNEHSINCAAGPAISCPSW
jgi:hypothetical protein